MSLSDSTAGDELDVGDVIAIDRSVGEIQSHTFATVVAVTARGPRIVGPSYPVITYANALKIDRKTEYDRIIGRDECGAYHLLQRDAAGERVVDVVDEPGSDPVHRQPITDDQMLAGWIEHVDDTRGWESTAEEFAELIDGGEQR